MFNKNIEEQTKAQEVNLGARLVKLFAIISFALRMTFKGFKQMLQNFFFRVDVFFTFNDLLKLVKYLYKIILVQVLLSSL